MMLYSGASILPPGYPGSMFSSGAGPPPLRREVSGNHIGWEKFIYLNILTNLFKQITILVPDADRTETR